MLYTDIVSIRNKLATDVARHKLLIKLKKDNIRLKKYIYIDFGWHGQFLVWRNELFFAEGGVAGPPRLNMPGEIGIYDSYYNTCIFKCMQLSP